MRWSAPLIAASSLALLAAPRLIAQGATKPTLRDGTWTGTMAPPEQSAMAVTYVVHTVKDSVTISFNSPMGSLPFTNLKIEPNALVFSWSPDPSVVINCRLTRESDGSYAGPCKDTGGGEGRLTMVPPKG